MLRIIKNAVTPSLYSRGLSLRLFYNFFKKKGELDEPPLTRNEKPPKEQSGEVQARSQTELTEKIDE